ncbi:MarR family transcriptional regulator [Methanocalculus taiwanensis]|nr:helix-turn-helix domain-containing protein [Methanocalculus taiwanensis]
MTTINKKILVLSYCAKLGERTVYDIAKTLGLDHAYIHRIVRQMADDGLLTRLEPVLNEKGAPAKPVALTLSGLREIFTYSMAAEEKSDSLYHAECSSNLSKGTAAIREMIARNLDLHDALAAYLCFFDRCAEELFKPDNDEEPALQNVRWVTSLHMIVHALIAALPARAVKRTGSVHSLGTDLSETEESSVSGRNHPDDGNHDPLSEGVYWKKHTREPVHTGSFGADLFFALEDVVSEIEEVSESSGRKYQITGYFSDEIVPLFKPYEEEITAKIAIYEKKGARLLQIRHRMACVDPGSFECTPKGTSDHV